MLEIYKGIHAIRFTYRQQYNIVTPDENIDAKDSLNYHWFYRTIKKKYILISQIDFN